MMKFQFTWTVFVALFAALFAVILASALQPPEEKKPMKMTRRLVEPTTVITVNSPVSIQSWLCETEDGRRWEVTRVTGSRATEEGILLYERWTYRELETKEKKEGL